MTLFLIIISSALGGIFSVLLAGLVMTVRPALLTRAVPRLISFSTGTLLGAALLGMIPHAAKALPPQKMTASLLTGLLIFYAMEKMLVWRHCHKQGCEVHASSGALLLFGDAFHNFVDGIVIAGAYLSSTPLGISVALSTIAHEVPQEVGEFAVYLHNGYSRRRALALNAATSLTSVLGALLGYSFFSVVHGYGPYLLSVAAAGFLYVALADLIPAQRGRTDLRSTVADFLLLAGGLLVIWLVTRTHN